MIYKKENMEEDKNYDLEKSDTDSEFDYGFDFASNAFSEKGSELGEGSIIAETLIDEEEPQTYTIQPLKETKELQKEIMVYSENKPDIYSSPKKSKQIVNINVPLRHYKTYTNPKPLPKYTFEKMEKFENVEINPQKTKEIILEMLARELIKLYLKSLPEDTEKNLNEELTYCRVLTGVDCSAELSNIIQKYVALARIINNAVFEKYKNLEEYITHMSVVLIHLNRDSLLGEYSTKFQYAVFNDPEVAININYIENVYPELFRLDIFTKEEREKLWLFTVDELKDSYIELYNDLLRLHDKKVPYDIAMRGTLHAAVRNNIKSLLNSRKYSEYKKMYEIKKVALGGKKTYSITVKNKTYTLELSGEVPDDLFDSEYYTIKYLPQENIYNVIKVKMSKDKWTFEIVGTTKALGKKLEKNYQLEKFTSSLTEVGNFLINRGYFFVDTDKILPSIEIWTKQKQTSISAAPMSDMLNDTNITKLRLTSENINKIDGLDKFTHLIILDLYENNIKKIEGLDTLLNLQQLDLSANKIANIEGLDKLVNLKTLYLNINSITEIKGLDKLTKLQNLYINYNRLIEIKGLDKLTKLQKLELNSNQITEIKGLDNLANLKELYLEANKITEIKGLNNLVNLQILSLSKNQITKIVGLDKLTKLQSIYLYSNQITKIEGLDKLVILQTLSLSKNQITKIEGLDNLVNLDELHLDYNQITKIEGLGKLVKLIRIYITNNPIKKYYNFQIPLHAIIQIDDSAQFVNITKKQEQLFTSLKQPKHKKLPIPKESTEWMNLCRELEKSHGLKELQEIATKAGFQIKDKSKRELCGLLASQYESLLNPTKHTSNCNKNEEDQYGTPFDEIPIDDYIMDEDKYCYSLQDLDGMDKSKKFINPYTRSPISNKVREFYDKNKSRIESQTDIHTLKLTGKEYAYKYKANRITDIINNQETIDGNIVPNVTKYFDINNLLVDNNVIEKYIQQLHNNELIRKLKLENLFKPDSSKTKGDFYDSLLEALKQTKVNNFDYLETLKYNLVEELKPQTSISAAPMSDILTYQNTNTSILDLSKSNIDNINGLDKFIYLTSLNLNNNNITKIEGLDKLVNLKFLYLDNNQITKLEGLDKLIELQTLNIDSSKITKIEGLDNLVKLRVLHLYNNKIAKIEGLDKLVELQRLYLYKNQITEIEGLDKLTKLEDLWLNNNQIPEIKGLDNLVYLKNIYLSFNKLTKIEGIDTCVNLQFLHLSHNQITEIEGLNKLVKLEDLYLTDNKITEIKGIDKLVKLKYLRLSNNQITKIKGLDKLVDLQTLSLGSNNLNKIECLDTLVNLQTLELPYTQITNIEGLDKLVKLQELYLNNNQIIKIEGLDKLVDLQTLNLNTNQITNIEGLDNLVKLKELKLNKNQITEIGDSLKKLVNLKTLYLSNNKIRYISRNQIPSKVYDFSVYNNPIKNYGKIDLPSLYKKLKNKTRLSIPEESTEWMNICRNLGNNYSLTKLESIAKNAGISIKNNYSLQELQEIEKKTGLSIETIKKRELCALLAKQYESLLNPEIHESGCNKNEEDQYGTPFNETLKEDYIMDDDGFCYSLQDLAGMSNSEKFINPYTRTSLGSNVHDFFNKNKTRINLVTDIHTLKPTGKEYVYKYKANLITDMINKHEDKDGNIVPDSTKYFDINNLLVDNNIIEKYIQQLHNNELINTLKLENLFKPNSSMTKGGFYDSLIEALQITKNNNFDYLETLKYNLVEELKPQTSISSAPVSDILTDKNININITKLDLSRSNIDKIDGLDTLVKLQDLNLSDNQITKIKGLDKLVELRILSLRHNQLTKIEGLDKLVKLIHLYLSENKITTTKGLDNLVKLTDLQLDNNRITKIEGLDKLVKLQELFLNFNQITEIKGLDALENLRILYLGYNHITKIDGLENLIELRYLELDYNQITEIRGLTNLVKLKGLQLNSNRITKIEGFDKLVKLNDLRLDYNQITKIEGLNNLVNLRDLRLDYNQITKIEGLNNLVNLSDLRLDYNQITKIEGLNNLVNLKELLLNNNQIRYFSKNQIPGGVNKFTIFNNPIKNYGKIDIPSLYKKLKNKTQLPIPEESTEWMNICRNLGNAYNLEELQTIAKNAGISIKDKYSLKEVKEIEKKTGLSIEIIKKRELCALLAKQYESLLNPEIHESGCNKNEEDQYGTPFNETPKEDYIMDENGFCYSLQDLDGMNKSRKFINPYTRASLGSNVRDFIIKINFE